MRFGKLPAALCLAALLSGGCASGPRNPFSTLLTSNAPEPAYWVEVRGLDEDGWSLLNGSYTLDPYHKAGTHFMPRPDRVRVDWNYGNPPARRAEFQVKGVVPDDLIRGGIVVIIEGETASLGWMDCRNGRVFRDHGCTMGGVLTEPSYEQILTRKGAPISDTPRPKKIEWEDQDEPAGADS